MKRIYVYRYLCRVQVPGRDAARAAALCRGELFAKQTHDGARRATRDAGTVVLRAGAAAAAGASVLAGARLGWVTGGLLSNLGGVLLSRYVSYVSYMCILHVFRMCFDVTRSIYI